VRPELDRCRVRAVIQSPLRRGAFCSLALSLATTDITLGRRLTTDLRVRGLATIEVRPPERVVRPELDRCRVRAVIQSPLRDAEDAKRVTSARPG
jgi:hypothetical protein